MSAQLPTGVVQGLVERISVRVQPLCQHVDRNAVERKRHEHAPLMRRQEIADRVLQRVEQLALLSRLVGLEVDTREEAPGLRLERDLTALPGAAPQLDGRLQQRSEERRVGKECRSRWSP